MTIQPVFQYIMIHSTVASILFLMLKIGVLFCVPILYKFNEKLKLMPLYMLGWYMKYNLAWCIIMWIGYFFDSSLFFTPGALFSGIASVGSFVIIGILVVYYVGILLAPLAASVYNKLKRIVHRLELKRDELKKMNNLE